MRQPASVVSIDQRMARAGECLYCFLMRVSETFGCDNTLKFTRRWIGRQRRSHNWVIRWAEAQDGCCDCEVLFNAFRDDKKSARHRKLRCGPSYELATTELGRCDGVSATES